MINNNTCPSHDRIREVEGYTLNMTNCEGACEPQWLDRVWNPGAGREVIEVGAECPNPCAG